MTDTAVPLHVRHAFLFLREPRRETSRPQRNMTQQEQDRRHNTGLTFGGV